MNGGRDLTLGPNTIVRIDPKTNEIVQSIRVGRLPGAIAATAEHVWVVNERDGTVSRVTRETGGDADDRPVRVGRLPHARRAWERVRVGLGCAVRLADRPAQRHAHQAVSRAVACDRRRRRRRVAVGRRSARELRQQDRPQSGRVEDSIRVGADPLVAAFGFGTLWVANSDDATVSVIRPGVARPETIIVRSRPFGIAAGEGAVWVGSNTFSTVSRIDPDTRRVVKDIDVSRSGLQSGLFSVAAGAGGVWAANWSELTLVRIDPETNQVVARIELPGAPRDVTTVGDDVWVSLGVPGEEFP